MLRFFFYGQNFLRQEISGFSVSLFLAATLAVLAGCGSGSGGAPAATGGITTTTGPTGTTTVTPAPTLTLALTDAAGATVNSISSGAPGTVKATLKDAAGAVVPNAVVTFSTTGALATITPSGTALTNASGVATVTLNAATSSSAGAGTITATAQVGTTAVTGSIGFAVGTTVVTVTAPALGVGAVPLSAFGTTTITVAVSDGGIPVSGIRVTFSSPCGNVGKAVLTSAFTTAGVATGSYTDNGCAATDVITASALGVTSPPTSLVVTSTVGSTGSIQFVSATPSSISLKGTGGVETSQVIFKVFDTSGNPVSGKTVTFALSTTVGGITLTSTTAVSDASGQVGTIVNAGTVSTPVRVTASAAGATAGSTVATQSSGLTITTGIPDQDSFSLSVTKLNIEAKDLDGVTTVLTTRLADHFNNPVPDGTVVNFTTEGGSIVGSCSTTGGACSSTLTSQAPRPADGRATVLAYAVGEESFIDLNGNGVADLGNELKDLNGVSTDLPEAFRDDNENGIRDANETFIDFNGDGVYNGSGGVAFVRPDTGDGQFNGVLCDSAISSPGTCSATRSIHVRRSVVIVFSGSTAVITKIAPAGTINLVGNCTGTSVQVDLRIVDAIGNPMPVGTTIAIATTDGTIGTGSSTSTQFTQANTNVAPAGANYSVSVRDDSVATSTLNPVTGVTTTICNPDPTPSGVLTVTVTTPGGGTVTGTVSTAQFSVLN